jgi:ankyrin repeat protein
MVQVDRNGNTLLHFAAAARGDSRLVRMLLDFGTTDVRAKNNAGQTAQDIAVEHGNANTAAELLIAEASSDGRVSAAG